MTSCPRMQRWKLVILVVCFLAGRRALGQDLQRVPAFTFHPAPGPNGLVVSDTARIAPHLGWHVGLWFDYGNDQLRARQNGETVYRALHHRLTAEISAGLGLFGYAELSLAMPLVLYQADSGDAGAVGLQSPEAFAAGDLRIVPRIRFWKDRGNGFGLSLVPLLTVPTGNEGEYAGEASVTFEPRVVLDYRFGTRAVVAANLGYRLRKDVEVGNLRVGDEFLWSLGASVRVWKGLAVLADIWGSVGFQDASQDTDSGIDEEEVPLEAALAFRYETPFGLAATVGSSVGLTDGWATPDFRVFGGLVFRPVKRAGPPEPKDRDGDGIADAADQCPNKPEDKDAFQDGDGCPDPDNDHDGIADRADKCPNKPEDKDAFQDDDGCPDPDNDRDGIPDTTDKCPNKPEDKDAFQDDDGCPDPDNDRDGFCDPNETIQAKAAAYSCQGKDACPNEAETFNGVKDDDGCPEKTKPTVRLTAKKIEILQKVYFQTNRAKIRKRSYPLLRAVAAILRAHPEIQLVQIEGHTDERGSAEHNRKLSERRAQAVRRFLVDQGVDPARLVAKGFGEDRPIQPNCRRIRSRRRRRACWAKNRRVEFRILKQKSQASGAPGTD